VIDIGNVEECGAKHHLFSNLEVVLVKDHFLERKILDSNIFPTLFWSHRYIKPIQGESMKNLVTLSLGRHLFVIMDVILMF